jgi:DNA-directed RNA polymerase subunit RPC12/RpoP
MVQMVSCPTCGGKLWRVHRTLGERLLYMAVYECRKCRAREPEPRWYALYLGDYPRCPRCGTFRVTRLAARDRIDPMYRNPLSRAQGYFGAALYHCKFCRIQFYDMREPAAREGTGGPAASANTSAKPA